MKHISSTNRALEALENHLEKMGGSIFCINDLSADVDTNNTTVNISICFNSSQLQEYISRLPPA